jgi:DNA-binding transcriptional LysR family regulator
MSIALVRLPSLDLIRGFVAVGRRMSITLAAHDLCLTQSAVSRQVLALEDMLGVRLLVRGHRAIAFTPEGERLFRSADGAIQQLQDVIGAIRVTAASRPVTVTTSIGVAGLWLLPRLGDFLRRHPGIDVRLSATNTLADLRFDGLDLAIRYCAPEAAPEGAIRLFGETVAPVAHPSLGLTELKTPEGLEGQVLLEFDGEYRPGCSGASGWPARGGGAQAPGRAALQSVRSDDPGGDCRSGRGPRASRADRLALADGRLARCDLPRPGPVSANAYWLLRGEAAPRAEVEEVVRWILAEAGAEG